MLVFQANDLADRPFARKSSPKDQEAKQELLDVQVSDANAGHARSRGGLLIREGTHRGLDVSFPDSDALCRPAALDFLPERPSVPRAGLMY